MIGIVNGTAVVKTLEDRKSMALLLRDDAPASGTETGSEQDQDAGGAAEEGEGFDMGSLNDNDFFVDSEGKKITVKESRETKAENERLKAQLAALQAGKGGAPEQGKANAQGQGGQQTDMMKELVRREAAREVEKHLKDYPLLDPEDVFEAIKTSSKPVTLPEIKTFMKELHEGLEKRFDTKNARYLDYKQKKASGTSAAEDINETGKGSQTPKVDKNKINLASVESIGDAFDSLFQKKT